MSDHFKNFDELFRDERDSSRPQRPAQQRPTRQAYASQWTDDAARPRRSAPDDLLGECLLPVMVDRMIREGALDVRVLDTPAAWFGVTYKEDRPNVVRALKKLHEQGVD